MQVLAMRSKSASRCLLLLVCGLVPESGLATGGDRATLNRLADETSLYLQLHAKNPVDWYPWSEEALARARREDKPIFLSVGYSTCYWCHVMERRVFSDPEIADLMNRWFINIKVDREERPDIDEIYMTTTQLLTGGGGWPNSVFLTPALKPFFAGTYFPPEDIGGRPGFPTVLAAMHRAWSESRAEVELRAEKLTEAMTEFLATGSVGASRELPIAAASAAVSELSTRFDREWGGFGEAPKFPSPSGLFLLWSRGERGDLAARAMVLKTLVAMGSGAIYDQLGGGFHRYTLDRQWRIPHFEKMLYDNALIAEILAIAAADTDDPDLERLARGTLDFLLRMMRLPNGAFKSAIDAETDGEEGAFYVWTRDELEKTLGAEDFGFLGPILGFDGAANFEGRAHTLFWPRPLAEHAEELGMERGRLWSRIEPLLARLEAARAERPFPRIDDKVLTDWNGMAIAAFARAGRALDDERYLRAAVQAADFVLGLRDAEGYQLHLWRQGRGKQRAFLDDYAFLIRGLLGLFGATGERRWLDEAERLTVEMDRQLRSPSGGFFTSPADDSLLVRSISASGGAIPAGNGIAIVNLLQLAELTERPIYRARALSAIQAYSEELIRSPAGLPTVALAVLLAQQMKPAVPTEMTRAEDLVATKLKDSAQDPEAGERPFILHLFIREGWHINANPASLELLIPTAVVGDVKNVIYPTPSSFRPAFAQEELKVFAGETVIRGSFTNQNPKLSLTYQACDDRRCLPPVTKILSP